MEVYLVDGISFWMSKIGGFILKDFLFLLKGESLISSGNPNLRCPSRYRSASLTLVFSQP